MDPIQGAITELLKLREKRATEIQKIDDAIDVLTKMTDLDPKPKGAHISTSPKAKTPKGPKSSRSGAPHPFSQYKGVTKGRPRPDGRLTYKAQIWEGIRRGGNGKPHTLGTFDIEEKAAAVAAEARGEKERAAELRAIVEQKQNNPDRPLGRRAPRKRRGSSHVNQEPKNPKPAKAESENSSDPEQMQIWTCKVCNIEYKAKQKPLMCPGCNRANFTVRPMTEQEAAE